VLINNYHTVIYKPPISSSFSDTPAVASYVEISPKSHRISSSLIGPAYCRTNTPTDKHCFDLNSAIVHKDVRLAGAVPSAPAYTELPDNNDQEYGLSYIQNGGLQPGDVCVCSHCGNGTMGGGYSNNKEVEANSVYDNPVSRTTLESGVSNLCSMCLQETGIARKSRKTLNSIHTGHEWVGVGHSNVCHLKASDSLGSTYSAGTAFNPSLDLTSSYYRCQAYAPLNHDVTQQQPIYFRYIGLVGSSNLDESMCTTCTLQSSPKTAACKLCTTEHV